MTPDRSAGKPFAFSGIDRERDPASDRAGSEATGPELHNSAPDNSNNASERAARHF
jgi:hypothetical protein